MLTSPHFSSPSQAQKRKIVSLIYLFTQSGLTEPLQNMIRVVYVGRRGERRREKPFCSVILTSNWIERKTDCDFVVQFYAFIVQSLFLNCYGHGLLM